eukprot:m.474804 g.474804  ORF g.474804 m.474804 type:complete len:934 (-) comp21681_c0_seq1:189-2990(-)
MSKMDANSLHGPPDTNVAEWEKVSEEESIPMYEEEGVQGELGGFEGGSEFQNYEEEDTSLIGYGFEAPPALDPFAQTDASSDIFNRTLECPEDTPVPAEDDVPTSECVNTGAAATEDPMCADDAVMISAETAKQVENDYGGESASIPASDCETSAEAAVDDVAEVVEAAKNADGLTSDEVEDDEQAPPPPSVDYDEIHEGEVEKEDDAAAAVTAAERAAALRDMVGLDVTSQSSSAKSGRSRRNKNRKGSKGSNGSSESGDVLVVRASRKRSGTKKDRTSTPEVEVTDVAVSSAPAPVEEPAPTVGSAGDAGDEGTSASVEQEADNIDNGSDGATSPLGARLPVDVSSATLTENEAVMGGSSIEADMQSPNDALLLFRSNLSGIESVIGGSGRMQYTCVSASESFVAFGCNSGGTFIFSRAEVRFLQVLPAKAGSVSLVKFAPDEQLLATATVDGTVSIWKGPWGSTAKTATLLKSVVEHTGVSVTSLAWVPDSRSVYSGDANGLVVRTPVLKRPLVPAASKLFPSMKMLHKMVANVIPNSEVVHRCGSAVVQLDAGVSGTMLISSMRHALVADPGSRSIWYVGTKIRNGRYGACFGPGQKHPAVFSARPGSRIWVAKSRSGAVTATMSLKEHFDCSSSPIIDTKGASTSTPTSSQGPKSLAFKQLVVVRDRYLLSWSSEALYVVDPGKGRLLGWYTDVKNIVDVAVSNEDIYVLHTNEEERTSLQEAMAKDAEAVSPATIPPLRCHCKHLSLLSPGDVANAMALDGNVVDAANMILEYHSNAKTSAFLDNVQQADLTLVRQKLSEHLTAIDGENATDTTVKDMEEKLSDLAKSSAQLRMEEENRNVEDAERAFLARLNAQRDSETEILLDAESPVGSSEADEFTKALVDQAAPHHDVTPEKDSLASSTTNEATANGLRRALQPDPKMDVLVE